MAAEGERTALVIVAVADDSFAKSAFLDLPPDPRNRVYRFALVQNDDINITDQGDPNIPGLLGSCRQTGYETIDVYHPAPSDSKSWVSTSLCCGSGSIRISGRPQTSVTSSTGLSTGTTSKNGSRLSTSRKLSIRCRKKLLKARTSLVLFSVWWTDGSIKAESGKVSGRT